MLEMVKLKVMGAVIEMAMVMAMVIGWQLSDLQTDDAVSY